MLHLEIQTSLSFDPRVDDLRQSCFPGPYAKGGAKDRFDDRSVQISILDLQRKVIAANGRLCRGPDSFFEDWIQGEAPIPTGAHVGDLGRCLVSPEYRGLGLLRLLCLYGFLIAEKLDLKEVVGAVLPGDKIEPMLLDIGFSKVCAPVRAVESSGSEFEFIPLACDLATTRDLRAQRLLVIEEKLKRLGVDLTIGRPHQAGTATHSAR